uniref:NAD(P)-binding domain-containing protein n=1 Tax=Roseomonas rosulenta TaxID=2748667 RepID=UPI0018E0623F
MSRIAILGAGAWGTALAIQAARAGCEAVLWARDAARAAEIASARENARYLPGVTLPDAVAVTADAAAALRGAAMALLVMPAQALRAVVSGLPDAAPPMLLCCKGVEAGSLALPLEVLAALRPGQPAGVLSGPNFAHEVARGLPAAAVVAARDPALREAGLALLGSPGFR